MPLQIPVTQTGLEASIQQAMRNAGRNAQINLGTNSRQINALSQPLGRITGQADEFTKSMEAANARVFAFGASVGIINGVSKAFGALVSNTIEVEKSLAEINTVLGASSDSLQKFGNKLFDVAKTTGQTFDVVAKGALELARQGLSTEETLKRINDALILSRLSGLDAQQSVEGLTAAFNSFKETGITTSEILNKLVVVSQKYSVSERDLIEGIKRSASVADQAGVSFDELVGIITTVQERTARGGAVIGNAFKTIFARIQDNGALQDLANLGVQVTDLEGKILPATKILQNLAGEYKNLSQLEQADIAKKLGGVYQLSNLLAAVKDLSSEQSKYNDIVKLSASATNEAYQKNAALNETLAALINKVSVSAQQLGATLGAIGIADNLKQLLDFFNKILEGIQGILGEESMLGDMFRGLAKGIGNVLAGPGLALFGAIIAKLSKDLISFGLESLKSFFKIGQAAKDIASVEKSIAAALGSNLTLQQQLFALEGNRAAQIKLMTDAIVQQEAVMRRMANTAGSLAGPLYQQGVRSTGGQGLRVPKAAGGYMPAVSQESRDISRGVGGARSGDKPVVIPNFAFGGGKKGTIVAHTGEFIVPNFAAGGSAIFNRDMVRSIGLPAGAKKIGAAGGFIPNFANIATETSRTNLNSIIANKSGRKTPQEVAAAKKRLAELERSKLPLNKLTKINPNGSDFGMIVGQRGVSSQVSRFADEAGRISSTQTQGSRYLIDIPIYRIQDDKLKFKESKTINEQLSNISAKTALKMAKDLSGGQLPNPDNIQLIKSLLNPGALAGTAGAIFEAGIAGILKDDDFKDYAAIDRNSLIDFKPYGRIRELFNVPGSQASKGLEAKATDADSLISSAAGKFLKNAKGLAAFGSKKASNGYIPNFALNFNKTPEQIASQRKRSAKARTYRKATGVIGELFKILPEKFFIDGILGDAAQGMETESIFKNIADSVKLVSAFGGPKAQAFVIEAEKYGMKVSAGLQKRLASLATNTIGKVKGFGEGFIPNFADPLKEAIGREMSAGVPASQIYVDQNSSLKNSMNPMGLMVANRRDEPAGGMQGINRARREGANPMMYGAANGFIPNYANSGPGTMTSAAGTSSGVPRNTPTATNSSADVEKPKRDLLGVVFAVQTGFSLLTGATADATSGFGKFSNIVLEGAGTFTTAMLAIQGLGSIGGSVGGVLSKLGPYGMAAAGAFAAFKVGSELINEYSGANKLAAENSAKLAKAAGDASVRLENLNPVQQQKVTKFSEDFLFNLKNRQIDIKTGQYIKPENRYTGGGTDVALNITDQEEQNLSKAIQIATLRGATEAKIGEVFAQNLKQNGSTIGIWKEEASKIQQILTNIKIVDDKELSKKLFSELDLDALKQIQGDYEKIQALAYENKVNVITIDRLLTNQIDTIKQKEQAEKDALDAAKEGIATQLKETLKLVRAQELLNARKLGEKTAANQAEVNNQQRILQISSNLTLSATERAKKLAEQENIQAKITAELEAQSQIADELDKSVAELSKGGVAFGSGMGQEEMEKAVESSKKFIENISKTPSAAGAISEALKGNNTELSNLIKGSSELGEGYKQNEEYIKLMTIAILQFTQGGKNILNLLDLEASKRNEIYDISVKTKQNEEDRAAIVEGINYKLESQASALDFRAGTISSQQSVNQSRKELETAIYERTSLSTTAEGFKKGLDEINQKYFDLEMAAEREKASLQIKSELTRNLKVDENSLKLVDTTIALNNLKGTVEESIQKLPSILAQAREAGQAVQSPYRLDDLSPISAKATNAISGGLFNDVNDQANNCAKVINRFADSIGLSIKGANDIANSFQNVGDAIDMSNLKPGDILLNTRGKAPGVAGGHVGMYLGGGQVLQASQKAFDQDPITRQQRAAITGFNTGDWNMARRLMPKGQEVAQFTQQGATRQLGLSEKAYSEAVKIAALDISKIGEAAEKAAKEFLGADAPAEEISKFATSIRQAAEGFKKLGVDEAAKKEVKRLEDLAAAAAIQPQTFAKGWADATKAINDDVSKYEYKLGEAIPTSFSNNLAQGIQDAVTGAKSLEDALLSAASSFISEIQSMAIKNLAQQFTSSLGNFGLSFFSNGGEVKKYASGGMINGGSGSKDDIPAMLMGGEYVVNKKSVQKYGPEFLNAINKGQLRGYAKGGKVEELPVQSGSGGFYIPGTYGQGGIEGRQNLLNFATQTATSGQYDVITGGDNYASINLEGESARLTTFGRTRGPQADAIRSAKEQAFGLYEQDVRAEEERKRQEKELKKQRKAMIKQMAIQVAIAVASSAASSMGQGFKAGWGQAASQPGATFGSKFAAAFKGLFSGAKVGESGLSIGGLGNWIKGVGGLFTGNFKEAGNYFKLSQMGSLDQLGKSYSMGIGLDGKNSPFTNFLDQSGYTPRAFSTGPKQSNGVFQSNGIFDWFKNLFSKKENIGKDPLNIDDYPFLAPPDNIETEVGVLPPRYAVQRRQATGGTIPQTSGIDTVPTLLSGGEFIMNRAASQNIGIGNLQSLNSGASSLQTEEKTEELNDRLIAKLDELIETIMEGGNAGSITINVDSNGKANQETSGETSESREKLARQIKDTVIKVIEQEKRLGGKLRRGL